jgi:hypothetical protein
MTAYELLDLRKGYAAEAIGLFKFWVSVTFAVLVAAHVAGVGIGIWGVVAAATMYSILTLVTSFGIRRFGNVHSSLLDSISSFDAEMENTLSTLGGNNPSDAVTNTLLGLQCFGFVGTTTYLLFCAGYIG